MRHADPLRRGEGRRRKSGGGWGRLLLVLLLLIAVVLFLEYLHRSLTPIRSGNDEVVRTSPPPRPERFENRSIPRYERFTSTLPPPQSHPEPPRKPPRGGGRVAIIVDDMGSSLSELDRLTGIGLPLTFSVIPVLPHARDVLEQARSRGYEVIAHLPMEPEGYPSRRVEQDALLLFLSDDEILQRLDRMLARLPGVEGANNHMGSRFTADHRRMRLVLGALKDRGLFFIDSVTSPGSVGYRVAREMGMKTARRQIFIDNELDEAALRRQLERLGAMARRHGEAIGICHPHPETIRVLAKVMPQMAGGGIEFVPVGSLVR